MEKHITNQQAEKMLNTMINHYGKSEWLKAETCYVKGNNITEISIETNKIGYTVMLKTKKSFDWIPYKTFTNYKSAKKALLMVTTRLNKANVKVNSNEALKAA